MANTRITMRKLQELLRLHFECKLTQRAIARSLHLSRSTVQDYLLRFAASRLGWLGAPMVGVLIGLMLLITGWGALTTWRDYWLVHQSGMVETQAKIVRRYVGHGRSNAFRVAYAFQVRTPSGGYATFSNRRAVGLALFKELAYSPEVTIRYLPADPRISEIEGNDHELVNATILAVASLLLAIGLAAFLINPRILFTPIALRRNKRMVCWLP